MKQMPLSREAGRNIVPIIISNTQHFPVLQTRSPNTQYFQQFSTSDDPSLNNTNDLFSPDELFQIFTKAITELKQCKNKLGQIQVIASLLKYGL